MKRFQIEWQGQQVSAWFEKSNDKIWVHLDGETFLFEPEFASRRKKANPSAGASADILAPMPGKITKLSAKIKDAVAPGQILVVMEAMKMEYTLKAKLAGHVAEIRCQVGDQVNLGQLLVHVSVQEVEHGKD